MAEAVRVLCACALALLAACQARPARQAARAQPAGSRAPAAGALHVPETPEQPAPGAARSQPESRAPQAPELAELRPIDGEGLRRMVASAGHKATLVNVWASWCGSCKQEVPMLLDLAHELAGADVSLLLLSADDARSRPRALELLREHAAPLPSYVLSGSVDAFSRAVDSRWKGAIPATFLLDAKARVRYFWNGPALEHEIAPIVQGLLAGEAIDGMTDFAAHGAP